MFGNPTESCSVKNGLLSSANANQLCNENIQRQRNQLRSNGYYRVKKRMFVRRPLRQTHILCFTQLKKMLDAMQVRTITPISAQREFTMNL